MCTLLVLLSQLQKEARLGAHCSNVFHPRKCVYSDRQPTNSGLSVPPKRHPLPVAGLPSDDAAAPADVETTKRMDHLSQEPSPISNVLTDSQDAEPISPQFTIASHPRWSTGVQQRRVTAPSDAGVSLPMARWSPAHVSASHGGGEGGGTSSGVGVATGGSMRGALRHATSLPWGATERASVTATQRAEPTESAAPPPQFRVACLMAMASDCIQRVTSMLCDVAATGAQ